jgi:flagellar hook-associated protein FlgK
MPFMLGLGAGLKALSAARLGMQTAGQNISNANTIGYSRQRAMFSASFPFQLAGGLQIGTGVDLSSIDRVVDAGLERRLRMQAALTAGAEVDERRWAEIEGIFDEPAAGTGAQLADLFGKLERLKSDPADRGLRGGALQSAKTLGDGLNLLANRLGEMRDGTGRELEALVHKANQHAKSIAELNVQILSLESNQSDANDLRDTRERLIKEVAELVEVQVVERSTGSVDLLLGGALLVSGARTVPLSLLPKSGGTQLAIGGAQAPFTPEGGRIGALLRHQDGDTPALLADLDALARNLALEFNRRHTTGVPRSGPFQTLTAHYAGADADRDGSFADELLASGGFAFAVARGELWVTVTNRTSGDLERTRIAIDPELTTLGDLAQQLDAIDHLGAIVDPSGRLRITAESGYGFDFGNRLDTQPNSFGAFGGAHPSFATAGEGPFALTVPASFAVVVDGSPLTVTLNPGDFQDPTQATVQELVAAINADVGSAATAKEIGGRLVIRSNSAGPTATLNLTDGANTPLAVLGLPAGTPRSGQTAGVDVEIAGQYSGQQNGQFRFVPDADGQIGVTTGLTVGVFDQAGRRVATLDVGRGSYAPGDWLTVADGIKVKFGPGSISATAHDVFALDTLADSDTTDALVALGLNSMFHGSTAADLTVSADLLGDPDLFAAGLTSAQADGANVARMLELRKTPLAALSASSFEDWYTTIVGDLGFAASTATATLASQEQLQAALERQREAVSGVDIDAEMVDLARHQQAFEAAARFLTAVNDMTSVLLGIGR